MTAQLRRHVRRHHSARAVVLWLAVTGVMFVLASAEWLVSRMVVFVPAAAVAVSGAYLAGRRHGSRRPYQRDRARRLEDAQRLAQAAELEQLANRSLAEIINSYRVIARRHPGGRP